MPAGSLNVANTNRVRYCVSPTGDLYRQIQTWTTRGVPRQSRRPAACPGRGLAHDRSSWPQNVVNDARPIFYYNADLSAPT